MVKNPLQQLWDFRQSFWLDSLGRNIIEDRTLERLIDHDGLRGVTSNPTIFNDAVSSGDFYDETVSSEAATGATATEIYDTIVAQDVRDACDQLRPVFDTSQGADGYVSLEEPPHLARETESSIQEGHRLSQLVDRPNLMIKVPATPEGIAAGQALLAQGVNVNFTLMFSIKDYDAVAHAYLSALEQRQQAGLPLSVVSSVASMFVSRIDTKVDGWIDAAMAREGAGPRSEGLQVLRGKLAIANAKLCYQRYRLHFYSDRFLKLAEDGARPQRVLFASTSTKDPAYPDNYYVDALTGADTVVTMAPVTVATFRDRGAPTLTLEEGAAAAEETFRKAGEVGIDLERVMEELQNEGIEQFARSYEALIKAIEEKRQRALIAAL